VPRIEVDRSLDPVGIPAVIASELLQHARETLPEECCGLILGRKTRDYRRLVRCRNDMNRRHGEDPAAFPRDASAAYWMSEIDYLHAWQEARTQGEDVTAVYHSHVGGGAYLSDMDLEYARHALFPFPGVDQIVVAVPSPDADHLSMRLEDGCVVGIGIFVWDAAAEIFRGRPARPSAP
jgi:proteasome lid subunit RPN8/RPN11